jgi:branched-subunit amino acid aminotransferase/4-amino-4-deoxychorismate lyase
MEFTLSAKTTEYAAKLQAFMDSEVFPAEAVYHQQREQLIANGKPQFLKNHFARVTETIKILKIKPSHLDFEQLNEEIIGLLKRNEIHEGGRMRITFYRKSKGFYLPKENDLDYFIEVEAIPNNHFELKHKHQQ